MTPTSTSGSSSARSTATSVVGSVSQSSAFRWRSLRISRYAARPRRSRYVPPRSATPVARNSSRRASASSVGAASTRRGARRSAVTRARTRGTGPARSRCPPCRAAALALGRDLRPRRHEPRKAVGGGVDELLVADRPAQVVRQLGVDRLGVGAQEPCARGVRVPVAARDVRAGAGCRLRASPSAQASARMNSAARSPIMIDGAFVLPVVTIGMIDASATRRPSMPCTRSRGSTTAAASVPILHVPT